MMMSLKKKPFAKLVIGLKSLFCSVVSFFTFCYIRQCLYLKYCQLSYGVTLYAYGKKSMS